MALAEILKRSSTSENLKEIRELLISGQKKVRISGLVGSGKALLLAYLKREFDSPFLVVTSNPDESWKLYEDLSSFLGEEQVRLFPGWEILPYEFKVPHSEVIGRRLESLYDLATGKNPIIITTIRACLEKTIPPEELKRRSRSEATVMMSESAAPGELTEQPRHRKGS
jgi:transcription-repair coupling factor (superfamily II helicase)